MFWGGFGIFWGFIIFFFSFFFFLVYFFSQGLKTIQIYLTNILLICVLSIPFFITKADKTKSKKYFLLLAFFLNFVLIGFRHKSIGADTLVYMNGFELIAKLPFSMIRTTGYNFELGYLIFNKFISIFTQNPYSIIIISTFISLTSIYYFIYKYSKNVWISVFIFNTMGGIFQIMTFLRQYLALSILLFCIPLIKKQKFVPFVIVVALATSFHKTSILFLLIYFLVNIKFDLTFFVIYATFLCGIFLSINRILPIVLTNFYPGYLQMTQWLEQTGGYKFLLLHGFLLVILICFRPDSDKIDLTDNVKNENILYNIYISSELILFAIFFASLKLGLISRLMVTFEPFILLIIPDIIEKIKPKQFKVAVIITTCFAMVLFSYILLKNTYIHNLNYKFLW